MKAANDGGALDDGVGGQVFEGDESATFFEIADQLLGHLAVVKAVGIGGDALEGAGQLRLPEDFAFLIKLSVALEDAFGVREASQIGVAEFTSFFGGELEAVRGQFDGRGDDALEAEPAIFLFSVDQSGDRTGSGDGAVAGDALRPESRCPWRPDTWFQWPGAGLSRGSR